MKSDKPNIDLCRRASSYAIAVGAVALGTLLRYGMNVWVGPLPTFITFYPAVMLTAMLGGFWPGLLATVLVDAVVDYWLLLPVGFGFSSFPDAVSLGLFSLMGVFMSTVAEFYLRARVKAVAYDKEVALREISRDKEFLASILERASQPFGMGYPDGRLGLINNAFAKLTGYTKDELKSIDWARVLTPAEWWDIEQEKIDYLNHTGQPIRYEKEYIRKDGTRVPIELLVHLMTDSEGKPEYYYSFITDITERKQAEKALRESERLYRAIGESIDYGVWICAPDGRNTYASKSFLDMVGLTQQECADFGWGDVLHPDDAEHTIAAWQDCVRTGETWDIEHRFRGVDGQWHPVLARGVPIRDEQGNITTWAGINLDISRLKETEEALLRSNQRFELLTETASRLLAAEQPQQIVEDLCRKVMTYLDCHAFFNFLTDEAAGRLHLNACAGIPAEEARKIEWLDYGVAVCGCAAAEGRRIVAEDIFTTPDPRTELVKSYGIQAYACHPITGADERIIGTLSFGMRNRPTFTAEELELMKTVADQVAIAMERKQAEEKIIVLNRELKHKVEELEAVFDTVPIGIAIAEDPQGYHIRGNPANEQLLGVMHGGELSLLPGLDRAPAGFRTLQNGRELAIEELPMQRAARGEIVTGQILDVVLQDGRVVNLYSNAAPLYDEQDRPRGAVGAFLDITDLRRAEEALRRAKDELELRVQERTAELSQANMSLKSEIRERQRVHEIVVRQSQLLESFFNHTITPLMFLDRHFNIIRVNEAYARAFRQDAKELPGCNYFDIYSHFDLQEIFKSVVATGEPFEAVAMPFTFPSLPELGTTYWNCTLAPLFDKHGETESLVFSLQDVTETQQAHQDLEEAARYTRSLIEASLDPLLTINVNGQIMDTNGATERITGLRREQLIGSDFSNYFTESEKAKKGYEAVFRNGFVRDYPLVIKDVSGKTRDVLYNATVYRNKGGEIQGVFAAARDITKRKRAENKLRESQERLKFLSSELISAQETERKRIASELHDSIASSLSAAILGLVRASRQLPEGTKGHELITRAITMVQNTVEETRRMMNLLRPPMLDDLGLLPAITWFLDQYSAIYSGLAINKDIAVEDAEIPESMKIDLYRIIQEAFTNIAKHSNASAVELSLKKKDDVIELTIADNGQGFNPDAGPAAKRGKSGLGLISMKERAELAGGTMLIQSIAGKGTTVCARWSAGA